MNKEDVDLLIKEFSDSSDKWTDLGLKNIYRVSDLEVRNSDREFNLFLSITSLSVAFLTIVIPIVKNSLSKALVLVTISFLITAMLGITLLLLTIKRDKRLLKEDSEWEHGVIIGYLQKTMDIRSKLYDYKKSQNDKLWSEVEYVVADYFKSKKGINIEYEKRKSRRDCECSAILLKYLKKFFWLFFAISVLILIIWLI